MTTTAERENMGLTKLWSVTIRPADGDPYHLDVEADTPSEAYERGRREAHPAATIENIHFLALVERGSE